VGQIWDAIVNGMASIIKIFATIGGNNTAIGIILFTIFIRTLILPLTLKSVRSGRAMQALQPYIKEINEKYKTKPGVRLPPEKAQAKQAEILALYKDYSVNPTASCLPILIQLPVFFAVYGAVTKSVGTGDEVIKFVQDAWNAFAPSALAATKDADTILANSKFLWIENLTKPDPYFILPVLMVTFQFITQRMAMPKGGGADDQQRRLNGIMQWTPLIFGFTALNFPAGPVLYWVTTSIFSFVQQYFITGFQSLSDIPGLGFLPTKALKLPKLEKRANDGTPRKKTLMERLAEQQEKAVTERAKTTGDVKPITEGSADAGGPTATSNFGRRAGAGPLGSKSNISDAKSDGSSDAGEKSSNEVVKEAYRQLSARPNKPVPNAGRKPKKK